LVFLSMMIGGDANNEEVDGLLIISFIPWRNRRYSGTWIGFFYLVRVNDILS
jgi:hypothetical protein